MTHGRTVKSANTPAEKINPIPEHIGWGSEALTKILRSSQTSPSQTARVSSGRTSPEHHPSPPHHAPPTGAPPTHSLPQLVKLQPDIALALLREQLVAPARLWLLLRFIDPSGQGWIDVDTARQQLATKSSPLRAFGWRQMRKLLARGEGLFWQRNDHRIWFRSPLKVAASLGISHLNYRPVGLPVTVLLQSVGQVRAHFYATFHSSRTSEKPGGGQPAPIARATLKALCQASRRTQRAYERRAGVRAQRNFAVGRPLAMADHQNQAWQRGQAVFRLSDHAGRVGRQGVAYTAWQLPNSYRGPHEKQPKGRQKRMNRKLADLFTKGMTGNGEPAKHSHQLDGQGNRRFFDNGAAATTKYNRRPDGDFYWPRRRRSPSGTGRHCQLWHWLPPQNGDQTATKQSGNG